MSSLPAALLWILAGIAQDAGTGSSGEVPPPASEAYDPLVVYLTMRSGEPLAARVMEVKDERAVLFLQDLGGQAEVPLSRLTPSSQYVVMREYVGKSRADARVRMAEYALEHEMYGQAMEEYAAALALDPENREAIAAARKEAREKAAKASVEKARRLLEAGEYASAREQLRTAIEQYGASEQAHQLLTETETRATTRQIETRLQELGEEYDPAVRAHERGREFLQKARESAGDLADAEDFLLQALDSFRRALETLVRIEEEQGPVPVLTGVEGPAAGKVGELRDLRQRIEDFESQTRRALLDTYVDLGHHFIVKGNVLEAHRYAGLAQSMDIEDASVRNLRRSVAAATARDRGAR